MKTPPLERSRSSSLPENRSSSSGKAWYERAFGADYPARYAARSDEAAREDLPFLLKTTGLSAGARVMDLCCGTGRYARALAAAGLRVTGLDLSAPLLAKAAVGDDSEGLFYVRADMRNLPLRNGVFDGGFNLFTSFGYFSAEEENAAVPREAARVLKPGAPFLLDFFNLQTTLAGLVPYSERRLDGVRLEERRWYEERGKRLCKETLTFGAGGKQPVRTFESVRAYSPGELTALLTAAGFGNLQLFGDLRGAPFSPADSPRCVVVGKTPRTGINRR